MLSTIATSDGEPAYGFMEGTSMASPYVSGLLALLRAVHPDLTSNQARSMLQTASDPLPTS
jgi:serine protease